MVNILDVHILQWISLSVKLPGLRQVHERRFGWLWRIPKDQVILACCAVCGCLCCGWLGYGNFWKFPWIALVSKLFSITSSQFLFVGEVLTTLSPIRSRSWLLSRHNTCWPWSPDSEGGDLFELQSWAVFKHRKKQRGDFWVSCDMTWLFRIHVFQFCFWPVGFGNWCDSIRVHPFLDVGDLDALLPLQDGEILSAKQYLNNCLAGTNEVHYSLQLFVISQKHKCFQLSTIYLQIHDCSTLEEGVGDFSRLQALSCWLGLWQMGIWRSLGMLQRLKRPCFMVPLD